MRGPARVGVVISAQHPGEILPDLVREAPAWIDDLIIVANFASAATTAAHGAAATASLRAAADAGARIIDTADQPIGTAIRCAIARLRPCDVVVLAGGHGHDDLRELPRLVDPIIAGAAELVLGAHNPADLNGHGPGHAARAVDWLVARSLRWVWGARLSEPGTFRAIRRDLLTRLEMHHTDQRWMIEMVVRALRRRSRILEMPVGYRSRLGNIVLNGVHDNGLLGRGRALQTIIHGAMRHREWRDARLRSLRPCVILLTDYPRLGQVKTRLIGELGSEGATALHDNLTRAVVAAIEPITQHGKTELEIRFHGGDEAVMRAWLGRDRRYVPQGEGGFGGRMHRATRDALADGRADAVCLVVDDCPQLAATHVQLALDRLQTADIVVGPTPGGGAYLLAVRALHNGLFERIAWDSEQAFSQLVALASTARLTVHSLEPLARVASAADLDLLAPNSGSQQLSRNNFRGYRRAARPANPTCVQPHASQG
ncbi:MAG: DUF2064 domain-containing protein [Phycisphaerae bacterium]